MAVPTGLCLSRLLAPATDGRHSSGIPGVEREANALMKSMRSEVVRRSVGGAIAGLVLAFGVAASASADAYIDENGIPVASSGGATVSIVGGEAVLLFGDEATDELADLIESAEVNEVALDDSSGLAVADGSGGDFNVALPDGFGDD